MKFEDLPKERQEKILENYREINTDYDWSECSLEDIAEQIKEKVGIDLNGVDLMFDFFSKGKSGVWIDRTVLTMAFNEKYPKLEDLDISEDFGVWAYIGLNRDDVGESEFYEDDEDELDDLTSLLQEKQDKQDKEQIGVDLEVVLDIFTNGYNSLYEQYSYLTSDKGIIETFTANEMEFEDED